MKDRPIGVTILAILVFITVFQLMLDFISMLGTQTWQDVSVSFLLNAIILIYCLLPGVKSAFGTAYYMPPAG